MMTMMMTMMMTRRMVPLDGAVRLVVSSFGIDAVFDKDGGEYFVGVTDTVTVTVTDTDTVVVQAAQGGRAY